MGFSSQRGAAARTILRARATGDAEAINDAENAVSGYLGGEAGDAEAYIQEHYPNGLEGLHAVHLDPTPYLDEEDQAYYARPYPGTVLRPRIGFTQDLDAYPKSHPDQAA